MYRFQFDIRGAKFLVNWKGWYGWIRLHNFWVYVGFGADLAFAMNFMAPALCLCPACPQSTWVCSYLSHYSGYGHGLCQWENASIVKSPLIGWAHTENDPCIWKAMISMLQILGHGNVKMYEFEFYEQLRWKYISFKQDHQHPVCWFSAFFITWFDTFWPLD